MRDKRPWLVVVDGIRSKNVGVVYGFHQGSGLGATPFPQVAEEQGRDHADRSTEQEQHTEGP